MPKKGTQLSIFFERQGLDKDPLAHHDLASAWIAEAIARRGKKAGELTFVFTTDEELLKINQQFLNHNDYTDVITFDYSANEVTSGDVYISIERVCENAKKFKVSEEEELARVMIHGVLHLLGLRDKSEEEIKEMRKEEEKELTLCPYL